MSAAGNKAIMTRIMDALARGDTKPFGEAMSEDFTWTIIGSTAWSRRYKGRTMVRKALIEPLFAQFAGVYTNRAINIIAESDTVVVECRGNSMTKSGKPYNNEYCYVITMAGGRLTELREYCDTALIEDVLEPPVARSS
jgi:ketosteroid isomerase-like protein